MIPDMLFFSLRFYSTFLGIFFFVISHALTQQLNKLSLNPFDILARVFASRGAIKSISHHFLSSI